MSSVVDSIRADDPAHRQQFIIDVIETAYGELIRRDPEAWRGKFRKMAGGPSVFYRGIAALYYADVSRDDEPFANEQTSRVWIHGDLHTENFGTYMDSRGVLVFDANDFDEAYVGPFTWDIKRLAASVALLGYQKAMSDEEIAQMIETTVRSYVRQVADFASMPRTDAFALTISNTEGRLLKVLRDSRQITRVWMLSLYTTVEDGDRRFLINEVSHPVDAATRDKVIQAFEGYLETIPAGKRFGDVSYKIKDVVLHADKKRDVGSAGLPAYYILVEGHTQALENDRIIKMKRAQIASAHRVLNDPRVSNYFLHDGQRIALSQRAMQVNSDPWLGYATLDGVGQFVIEKSPYDNDLDWDDITELDEMLQMLGYLGQAAAKIHCVSDIDSKQTLVPFSTDKAINGVLQGREEEFVRSMAQFGTGYAGVVLDDYRLFIDAFRNHRIAGL